MTGRGLEYKYLCFALGNIMNPPPHMINIQRGPSARAAPVRNDERNACISLVFSTPILERLDSFESLRHPSPFPQGFSSTD